MKKKDRQLTERQQNKQKTKRQIERAKEARELWASRAELFQHGKEEEIKNKERF